MGCQLNRISKVYNRLFFGRHTLYPPRCALCGRVGNDGRDLCSNCLADLPRIGQYCHRCGVPLTDNATLCGPCSHAPPPFESSTIPFRYAPPLDYLLLQMKFHQRLHLAPLLGCLLAEAVTSRGTPLPELLLPVPLHHSRLRKRGYNQALELVRCLAHELSLPFACNRIVRQRHTPAQTSLRGKERRKNLRDAFRTNGDLPRHIALVDDVVTTGATVTEVAKTLKRAGVEIVEIWAIARAGGD
jgi:ComF family protein